MKRKEKSSCPLLSRYKWVLFGASVALVKIYMYWKEEIQIFCTQSAPNLYIFCPLFYDAFSVENCTVSNDRSDD
jgi:hypothetical protein